MFGYLRPVRGPEHEFFYFRAHYCGMCMALKHDGGNFCRLFLSYDQAFVHMLLSAYLHVPPRLHWSNCILHPVRKRPMVHQDALAREVTAVSRFLAEKKLLDDVHDEKGLRKWGALRLLSLSRKRGERKSQETMQQQTQKEFQAMSSREQEKSGSVESLSGSFGKVLRALGAGFFPALPRQQEKQLLDFLELVGKWLYVMDCIDDLQEDICKKRYNPLKYMYAATLLDPSGKQSMEARVREIRRQEEWRVKLLVAHMHETFSLFQERLDFRRHELQDFVTLCIPWVSGTVLRGEHKGGKKSEHGPV
ncbi:MAG TPA: DUF5685 family protein [Thermotogota bacterium]|nr:DUF5685 family protein [Thermotogota bacterium]HRW91344.1 DUF5685 family protein [Thermotogota bacterium]